MEIAQQARIDHGPGIVANENGSNILYTNTYGASVGFDVQIFF